VPAAAQPGPYPVVDGRRKPRLERTIRMEINERFYDESAFLPIGSPMPEPNTTGGLLNRLKLGSADHVSQSIGIAEWLRSHTPSASLVRSLRRRGFGDLVDVRKDPQPCEERDSNE
jgi:hypothetical protein